MGWRVCNCRLKPAIRYLNIASAKCWAISARSCSSETHHRACLAAYRVPVCCIAHSNPKNAPIDVDHSCRCQTGATNHAFTHPNTALDLGDAPRFAHTDADSAAADSNSDSNVACNRLRDTDRRQRCDCSDLDATADL